MVSLSNHEVRANRCTGPAMGPPGMSKSEQRRSLARRWFEDPVAGQEPGSAVVTGVLGVHRAPAGGVF